MLPEDATCTARVLPGGHVEGSSRSRADLAPSQGHVHVCCIRVVNRRSVSSRSPTRCYTYIHTQAADRGGGGLRSRGARTAQPQRQPIKSVDRLVHLACIRARNRCRTFKPEHYNRLTSPLRSYFPDGVPACHPVFLLFQSQFETHVRDDFQT